MCMNNTRANNCMKICSCLMYEWNLFEREFLLNERKIRENHSVREITMHKKYALGWNYGMTRITTTYSEHELPTVHFFMGSVPGLSKRHISHDFFKV